jgi:hypothetical protein
MQAVIDQNIMMQATRHPSRSVRFFILISSVYDVSMYTGKMRSIRLRQDTSNYAIR